MSNNAAVASDSDLPPGPDGEMIRGEIGRAQALQARACKAAPSIHMNPVLLKPQTDIGSQVVLRGRVLGNCPARIYHKMRHALMPAVLDSLRRLQAEADLVIVEGAGSGAEVYLRSCDITNMRLAESADLPVVILSDIDRGGTMAAIVGSHALLSRGRPRPRRRLHHQQVPRRLLAVRAGLRHHHRAYRLAVPRRDPLVRPRRPPAGRGFARAGAPGRVRRAGAQHRGAAAVAHRQFRRPRPAGRRAGGGAHASCSRATRSPPTPTSSSCPAPRPPAPTSPCCARRAGTSTSSPMSATAAGWWGCAPASRCWAKWCATRRASKARPARPRGSGLLDVETEITPDKRLVDLDVTDQRLRPARHRLRDAHGPHHRAGPGASPWLMLGDGAGARPEGAVSADGRVTGAYVHGLFGSNAFRAHWLTDGGGGSLRARLRGAHRSRAGGAGRPRRGQSRPRRAAQAGAVRRAGVPALVHLRSCVIFCCSVR